ncbi:MAG: 2-oxoglutarate translocator [Romboutsia timonensis]|jgi:hypothetical protein|uniref:2-oxoglutarate translocator n=1 Tax=Romboutsia timonensis TaxID=1776391 RepID=UPI0008DB2DEF|nr:2-oxoglutarate translocator [Romboutsia timonensis]MBS5026145.1 2-oxoglutarate translocator [Peptostreptococcaceae bacterium]MDU7536152.1 2-oxoglutarate translocator [Peptostreptococcaceae bacterium]MDY3002560.1 2-oxoglutarate translocator [Romboutsia timonensis]MEE0711420.1 2-oxoglutarate translocator [Romboutsia timonensis]
MKNSSLRRLFGILCFSVGLAIILSMILPNWIWTSLIAFTLMGCGVLFFLY